MTWTGRLEFLDLEGGVWRLHTHDEVYTLHGRVPAGLEGAEVEVDGEHDESFGFHMTGPAIAVHKLKKRERV